MPFEENPRIEQARNIGEWVTIVAVAVIAALVMKAYVLEAFYIPSESMEPTLHGCTGCNNDRVLVNKLAYRTGEVERGDIIVFERPSGEASGSGIKDLIKRVVGLPGDVVESRNGVVYVNGSPLAEPYLPPETTTDNLGAVTVPDGQVFVMGDNRDNSQDSRYFGPIDQESIVGEAFLKVWPLTDITLL